MLDRKQPVIFAGENHMITLFEPGQAEPIAAASVWRCSYSAQGEGFVLCLWHTPDQSGSTRLAAQGIYSDNMPLAIMVRDRFNQYFAGFDARGFARIEPQPARFQQYGEGMRRHRIACATADYQIELTWNEVFDAALEIFYNTSGPEPYHVSAVICNCRSAAISIDGVALHGAIRTPSGASISSGFLAFSETWVAAL